MHPKSFPANCATRTTARKSVLKPPQLRPQSSSSSGHNSPAAPPPPTAAAASGLSSNDTVLLTSRANSSKIKNPPPPANPSKEPRDKIKKTVPMFGEKTIRAGDQVQELKVTSLGSTGKGKSLDDDGKGVVEPKTRKVVKKVVRVVKKIVKRKVPKRALLGAQENGEVEGVVPAVNPVEVEQLDSCAVLANKVGSELNGSFGNDDIDWVESVIKDSDENLRPVEAAYVETDGVENGNLKETPMLAEEGLEISPVSRGNEKALEVGNEKLEDVLGLAEEEEVVKIDPFAERVLEGENVEEMRGATCGSSSQGFAAEENDGNESMMVEDQSRNDDLEAVEMKIGDDDDEENDGNESVMVEDQSKNENLEAVEMKIGDDDEEDNDGNKSVMVEDQSKNGNLEVVEMKIGHDDEDLSGCSVLKGKKDVGFSGTPTLSGEMEALERRKRRRTEIFVGGLDKDTKEEDIRKLFEQAGEVTQVRLVQNSDSSKTKGFAFLQYASAEYARKALEKFSTVEICGKRCGVRAVEGNDTIYLGNINKRWKSKDVRACSIYWSLNQTRTHSCPKLLNIDQVVVMANPTNHKLNRGFAFVEFQTTRDAQIAFSKLEKHDIFVKQMKIKVGWAQPLIEPNEEELLKVRTVYVEHLPSFWDVAKARNFFKRFGEIESISLASARRKDIAFVNYLKREAALACIETCAHEQVDDGGLKVKVKASLAKPCQKVKQAKQVEGTSRKEHVKEKRMTSNIVRFHDNIRNEKHISKNLEGGRVDRASSTSDELLMLLRQQAQVRQPQPGLVDPNHHYDSAGSKRPFSALGNHAIYPEPRVFSHPHSDTPYLYGSTSRADMAPMRNSQGHRDAHTLELPQGFEMDPHFKMRERTAYFGPSGSGTRMYQRY